MVESFRALLARLVRELDYPHLLFWEQQLDSIPLEELPITPYGVSEAKRSTCWLRAEDLAASFCDICEWVFAYSRDDDLCEMQGQYFYYYDRPTGTVFKECDLGACDLVPRISNFREEVRVATVSDLGLRANELL